MIALLHELRQFPGPRIWLTALFGTTILLFLSWLLMPDFMNLADRPTIREMAIVALVAFFFPAFFEEFVFRGILNRAQSPLSISLSTAAFVLWHPLEAHLFLKEAIPWFTDPRFLAFVALFGFWFCILRKVSGSLWPPIICHWMVVLTWKGLGGARFLTG